MSQTAIKVLDDREEHLAWLQRKLWRLLKDELTDEEMVKSVGWTKDSSILTVKLVSGREYMIHVTQLARPGLIDYSQTVVGKNIGVV